MTDQELLEKALREILAAPGTSAKALEAKASAARQLARMKGLLPTTAQLDRQAEDGALPPDPMAGLDELAPKRAAKGKKS